MRAQVVAIIASIFLAGCSTGGDADAGEDSDVGVVTDPTDTSYNTSAGYHIHDYWGGDETLTVLDRSQGYTFTNNGGADSRWPTRFYVDDGKTIPQGTATVTVTVTWSHDTAQEGQSMYGDMELWAKTAQENEAKLIEDALEPGAPVEMALEYNDSDLPHQLISAWEFQVHIRGTDSFPRNHFEGTIHVQVDAHRGLELRPFPPHPDHWQNRTEFLLAEDQRSFAQTNWPTGGFNGDFDQRIRPFNGTLVLWGTDRVEVDLQWDDQQPAGGLTLWYHHAGTRQHKALEPGDGGETSAHYEIDVHEEMADGPYSNASLWEFKVSAPHDPAEEPTFDGSFNLEATVYKG